MSPRPRPRVGFASLSTSLVCVPRKGRITPTQSDAFIADLGKLGIERDAEAPDRAFTYLLAPCRTHQLTSHDAIYLDLALRRSLPSATLVDDLRKTAKKLGVRLLG